MEERKKITHVVVDDTSVLSWASWLPQTSKKDAQANDPYVDYLKESPDAPDAVDPAQTEIDAP